MQYALVTGSLRQGLLASMSTSREGAEVTQQVLEVFANCTSNAGARRALADPAVLCRLLDALKSPSPEVQTRIGSVLAHLSVNSHIRRELRDLWALEPIFGAVMATKNRHLRMELMGAACNICFTGLAVAEAHLSYLISVLASKSIKLRVASINVLRNACLNMENRAALVRLRGVPALLAYLPDAKPEDRAHILMIVAACAECVVAAVSPEALGPIVGLLEDSEPEVRRAALRCVAAAATVPDGACCALIAAQCLPQLFAAALGDDYVAAEHAARALKYCLVREAQAAAAEPRVRQVLAMCASANPVVVRRGAQILSGNARAAALVSPEDRALLAALLDFPETGVREAAVGFVLGGGGARLAAVRASAAEVAAALGEGRALLEAAAWEVRPSPGTNGVELTCLPLSLPFASAAQRSVFLARLALPGRPRLRLPRTPAFEEQRAARGVGAAAVAAPRIEQLEALAEFFRAVSELGRQRAADMAAVMRDAAVAELLGERAAPSGAARRLGPHSPLLALASEGREATYAAQHDGGPAAAAAEGAAPHLGEFAYFEVLVTACGEGSGVVVGMAGAFAPGRLPGWAPGSFGLHGDDGNFYGEGRNREFGPRFGLGDVVGCGVDEIKGELFFTLNGRFLGVAATGVNSFTVRPCVGLVAAGQSVLVNFGQHPFLWDFSFVASPAVEPAPLALPETARPYPSCTTAARRVDPLDFAGGLWATELALLYARLCVVDPAVDAALQQTTQLFAKWKTAQ